MFDHGARLICSRLVAVSLLADVALVSPRVGSAANGRAAGGPEHAKLAPRALQKAKPYRTKRVRFVSRIGDALTRLPWVSHARRIPFYSASERKAFEVTVKNGLLYYRGQLLNTEHPVAGAPKATYIFVMAKDGTIYAAPNGGTERNIHHSSFLSGGPAAAAGTIVVVDGVVQRITNKGGHSGHRAGKMRQVLAELSQRGVDVDGIDTSFTKRPSKLSVLVKAFFSGIAQKLR